MPRRPVIRRSRASRRRGTGTHGLCLVPYPDVSLYKDIPRLGSDYSRTTGIHPGEKYYIAGGNFFFGSRSIFLALHLFRAGMEWTLNGYSYQALVQKGEATGKAAISMIGMACRSLVFKAVLLGKPSSSLRQIQYRFQRVRMFAVAAK